MPDNSSGGPACAHSRIKHAPKKHADGSFTDRWVCEDCGTPFVPNRPPWRETDKLEQAMRAELQLHPRLTITHETIAEVRSATHVRDIIAIVHPKLGEIGGQQTELKREGINRVERLAPKCRLYILQGRIEQGECLANIEFVYAMGSDETFEQARDWLVKAWGFEVCS